MKKFLQALFCAGLILGTMSHPVLATENDPASYVGHYSTNQSFAFVNSRYYDGTNYVKVFNWGWAAGQSDQYYVNGDWTDLNHVYTREDYTTGNPTNLVGSDGDVTLSSANAGTYTLVNISNLSPFGPQADNYVFPSTLNNIPTYIEIWKVAPDLTLTSDVQGTIQREQTFTLTLTINNDYNNSEGLPTTNQVSFSVNNAQASSAITQSGNTYTQTFIATTDTSATTIEATAGVTDTATNYKEGYQQLTLDLAAMHSVSYQFVSGTQDKTLPQEVMKLLPESTTAQEGETVTATKPETTKVTVDDGVWTFTGYDANEKVMDTDITFTGTWTFTANPKQATTSKTNNANNNTTQTKNSEGSQTKKTEGTQTGIETHATQWIVTGVLAFGLLLILRKKHA